MKKDYQTGFTLIELSIVLVIIGLIVGGVLVGQDLIEAARIRQQVSQLQAISTAVNTFRLKYNAIPGDIFANAANVGLMPGSGAGGLRDNGSIEDATGSGSIDFPQWEPMYFFSHLVQANLLPDNFIRGVSATNGNPCVDESADGGTTVMTPLGFYALTLNPRYGMVAGTINGSLALDLGIYDCSNLQVLGSAGVLTPAQAWAIDTKMDDGVPATGMIRPQAHPWYPFNGTVDNVGAQCVLDSTSTTYNVTSTVNWCSMFVGLQ